MVIGSRTLERRLKKWKKKKGSFEHICLSAISISGEMEKALGRLRVDGASEVCDKESLLSSRRSFEGVRDRGIKLSARLKSQASFIRMG